MLFDFATELIVEILLYLPYREFLRVIRLNSRLWSIAHHPKSSLRHRLRSRTSRICLAFEDNEINEDEISDDEIGDYEMDNANISLKVSIDETIPGSTNKRCIERELKYYFPKVAITDAPYVESEEDRNIVRMEKSRVQLTYRTDDGLDGSNHSKKTYKYDQFPPDLSMRLAICNIFYVAEYFTINEEFRLTIDSASSLNKFLLHFDAYDIRFAPISIGVYSEEINLPQLYESKLFQQKIYKLFFSLYCKAIGNDLDFRHYEIHRNKLREVKRFEKYANTPIKHTDDDLLLLDNIESLTLYGEYEITGDGIARLVKKIYENKQGRVMHIYIETKPKFTIKEVLKYVPECKITKDAENDIYFTNTFDEVFKIECLDQVEYTRFRLYSHDL